MVCSDLKTKKIVMTMQCEHPLTCADFDQVRGRLEIMKSNSHSNKVNTMLFTLLKIFFLQWIKSIDFNKIVLNHYLKS